MRILALLAVSTGLLVTGCGGGSPAEQARATWIAASRSVADGAGTRFCALATAAGRNAIIARTSLPCEDSVRLLAGRLSPADKAAIRAARITSVDVEGDTAVVTYVLVADLKQFGFTGHTTLQREDGEWRLQGI